jgi:5-methylcytosine-specific restriction endonuclease McrA
MVSGRTRGELPDGPSRPEAKRHRVTLDLDASAFAMWQEARREMVRAIGQSVDDATLVSMLAHAFLGGSDEGRSNYQIAMTLCERCRHATQRAGNESVTVEEAVVEAACCDAQTIGRVDEGKPKRATQTIPPATRRAVIARHQHRCAVPGCPHGTFLDLHHTTLRSEGGDHDPEFLIPLCSTHHAMAHRGSLVVRGSFREGFMFEHADAQPYGSASFDAKQAELFAQAFTILCGTGFKEKEARAMLDGARPQVGADADLDEVVTSALRRCPLPSSANRVREACVEYQRSGPRSYALDLSC